MNCNYTRVCPFFKRVIPIHDAMFETNLKRYCEGEFSNCAIYQVIINAGIMKVPKDLYPNQTFRVNDILK